MSSPADPHDVTLEGEIAHLLDEAATEPRSGLFVVSDEDRRNRRDDRYERLLAAQDSALRRLAREIDILKSERGL